MAMESVPGGGVDRAQKPVFIVLDAGFFFFNLTTFALSVRLNLILKRYQFQGGRHGRIVIL